jgi:hypothetical protein
MKLVAIMQPYFFPYIGYFQLIHAVNTFIVYDNIQYTKKGWINRNRFLRNGTDETFSIPLRKAPDGLHVVDRVIASDFKKDKLLNQLREAYRRAPYFESTFPIIEESVMQSETNLFHFIRNSIGCTCKYLGIETEIIASSAIPIDHSLRAEEKVIAICKAVNASKYINAIGGTALYAKENFRAAGLDIEFLKSRPFEYKQFEDDFVPWLSIVDVMMFNSAKDIRSYLVAGYELA